MTVKHQLLVLFLLFSFSFAQKNHTHPNNNNKKCWPEIIIFDESTKYNGRRSEFEKNRDKSKNVTFTVQRFGDTQNPFSHLHGSPQLPQYRSSPYSRLLKSVEVIKSCPRGLEVYKQNHFTHTLINNINNKSLPIKIASRILLLEAALPRPYDKKLKKALKKFTKKVTDLNGNLSESLEDIDEKLFNKFLQSASLDPRVFALHIDTIESNKNINPQGASRSTSSSFLLDMIRNQQNWSYEKLTKIYESGQHHGNLVQKLYDHFTRERYELPENQKIIQQDPVWQKATPAERADSHFQSTLLLRSLYAQRLKEALIDKEIFSEAANSMIYAVVDQQADLHNMPADYEQRMIKQLTQKIVFNSVKYPDDFRPFFFNASGILKKYSADPFVKKHFSEKRLHPDLQRAINTALLVRDSSDAHNIQAACQDVLHNAASFIWSTDEDLSDLYKSEACSVAEMLARGESPTLEHIPMDQEKVDELYEIWHTAQYDDELERAAACEKAIEENFQESTKIYQLNPQIKAFMFAYGINPYSFSQFHGNFFQHYIIQNLIELIEKTANLIPTKINQTIATLAQISQDSNSIKQYKNSTTAADAGWGLYKYLEAVALGLLDTANGFKTIAEDPVKYLYDSGVALASLAGRLYRYIPQHVFFPDTPSPLYYLKKLGKDLIKACRESTGPELVRGATHFISEALITKKIMTQMGGITKTISNSITSKSTRCAVVIQNIIKTDQDLHQFLGYIICNCYQEINYSRFIIGVKNRILKDVKFFSNFNPCNSFEIINNSTYRNSAIQAAISSATAAQNASTGATAVATLGASLPEKIITTTRNFLPASSSLLTTLKAPLKAHLTTNQQIARLLYIINQRSVQLIQKTADTIKKEYLSKTYAALSAADKATLNSTELGRSLAKLGESLQMPAQFLEEAALIAAQGPQPRLGSGKNILTKVRIMHSSCTKLEFLSKNLCKPKIVGGHTNNDLFLKIDEAFKLTFLAERQGCQLVSMQVGDQDPFPKTWPPKNWGPKMLYDKIIEAVNNASSFETVDKGKQIIVETIDQLIVSPAKNCRWTVIGKTSEGIEMKMAIDYKDGMIDVVSGYIHDLWIQGLRP